MKIIDAHAHIGYFGGFFDVGITPDELLKQMDQYEIEKSVICALDNEAALQAVKDHPDRFVGLAWLNPWDGEKAIQQARHYITDEGFKGIKLHPLLHAFVANEPAVYPIAECAQELHVPLFIHSGHPPFSLPWSIAQLADMYPDVDMVMIHMGHGHGVYIQSAIDMAKKYPNLYLETSGMPMHTKIKEAYETVGPNRVMFGTDIPFHHPSVEIQRSKVSGLTELELQDLFYNNVKSLLNL